MCGVASMKALLRKRAPSTSPALTGMRSKKVWRPFAKPERECFAPSPTTVAPSPPVRLKTRARAKAVASVKGPPKKLGLVRTPADGISYEFGLELLAGWSAVQGGVG